MAKIAWENHDLDHISLRSWSVWHCLGPWQLSWSLNTPMYFLCRCVQYWVSGGQFNIVHFLIEQALKWKKTMWSNASSWPIFHAELTSMICFWSGQHWMSHGTFKVHNGPQVADFISWIMPLWTMFGKNLTAVLSSGEGLDDQCSTWLARRPTQVWNRVVRSDRSSPERATDYLQSLSAAQPLWTLLGCGSMVR
jgi:hypothetical protein